MLQHLPTRTVNDDQKWTAVLERDRHADGRFYYGVTSTHVFCRPSCPSRRPRKERVRFFETSAAAQAAGFRPCLRCQPTAAVQERAVAAPLRRAASYLAAHEEAVPLAVLARIAKLSPSHLQREFKRALGVSPREYQAAMRAERFRGELRKGNDVTTAVYQAGYGSPSRVYEHAPTGRGVRPSAYRRGAAGLEIGYTVVSTPLGRLLVAATRAGVCAVKLGDSAEALEADLRREFPDATLARDQVVSSTWVRTIVEGLNGGRRDHLNLPLDVRGTAFQWQVWRALQQIPFGETRSYAEVADAIGRPKAVRAVARACATNPVCVVVPCHRVVAKSGSPGGYRWGAQRKRQLLAVEAGLEGGRSRKAK